MGCGGVDRVLIMGLHLMKLLMVSLLGVGSKSKEMKSGLSTPRYLCEGTGANHRYTGPSCAVSGEAPQYHLRLPEPGIWVCSVPSGWLYSQERMMENCVVGGQGESYLLS